MMKEKLKGNKMKKMLLLLSMILATGCIFDVDYTTVKVNISIVNLTITEKEAYNTYWKVSGIAVNESNYGNATPTPWYIEASFDTTNSNTTPPYLGTETKTINTSLEPGDTLYWELFHYNNNLIESDYPDFVIKNLHAYEYISVANHDN